MTIVSLDRGSNHTAIYKCINQYNIIPSISHCKYVNVKTISRVTFLSISNILSPREVPVSSKINSLCSYSAAEQTSQNDFIPLSFPFPKQVLGHKVRQNHLALAYLYF